MNAVVVMLCVAALAQGAANAKVETSFDKSVDFKALRTYSWVRGYDAYNPEAHKRIVTALEEEMTRLGFTKATSSPDVTLSYYTVASTEVDLKSLEALERSGKQGDPNTKTLGRLLVIMRFPNAAERIWSASTREYVDADIAKFDETIRAVTRRLFDAYPSRVRR
jgi:hypothetical protein